MVVGGRVPSLGFQRAATQFGIPSFGSLANRSMDHTRSGSSHRKRTGLAALRVELSAFQARFGFPLASQ